MLNLVLQRNSGRPSLHWRDRAFWDVLCSIWPNWRKSLYIVQPDTLRVESYRIDEPDSWAKTLG